MGMASYMPQRRIATPADRFTAPVVTDASRPASPVPDAEPATTNQSLPHERVPLQRPRPPVPLFCPDTPPARAPLPQIKQASAPIIPQVAATPAEAASSEGPEGECVAGETMAELVRGVVQARMAVKQAGSGTAPIVPNTGGPPPIQRKNVTGLPDGLKAGVEALFGIALDDVRVRYNGLRQAKLSWRPCRMLKKYITSEKVTRSLGDEA